MAARKSKPPAYAAVTYHPEAKLPLHRLPFVGRKDVGISFWSVPLSGGYGGGCVTGAAMASAYLGYLKSNRERGGLLQCIVLDMLHAYEHAKTDVQRLSLEGQIVGFCSEVCTAVQKFAPLLRHQADADQVRQLIARANAGLAGDWGLGSRTPQQGRVNGTDRHFID